MKLFEAKDILRSHFSNTNFPTGLLDEALRFGRQEVEQHGNFWWARFEKNFSLQVDKQDYSIVGTTDTGGLNIPKFKDLRALFWREESIPQNPTSTTPRQPGVAFEPVSTGQNTKEELDLMWDLDDIGEPEAAVVENTSLFFYPPKPDKAYLMRLYCYVWTDNPSSNLEEDDLLRFFPYALIYGALAWGYEMQLKDLQGATYWRQLLGGQPYGRGGMLKKIRAENLKRDWQDRIQFEPHTGPDRRGYSRVDNLQIYVGSGWRVS